MVVMKFAKSGNLRKALPNIVNDKWIVKLEKLNYIISGLDKIHQQKLIHCDFHHGNILFEYMIFSISDLGLCFTLFNDEIIYFRHTVKSISLQGIV